MANAGGPLPIVRVRWRPFRLPLIAPFETASGPLTERLGVLIELTDGTGHVGVGEATPLPGRGDDTVEGVLRLIEWFAAEVAGSAVLAPPARLEGPGSAALDCAFDSAMLDIAGQRLGFSVAGLLVERPASPVAVNAVIGLGSVEDIQTAGRRAVEAGYRTLKLKVGRPTTVEDVAHVKALREACPDVTIRVDANGAWGPTTAAAALQQLAPFRIEYVEQPLPANDRVGMARLRRESPIPIAADEAASTFIAAQRIIEVGAADILVLKPMQLGGVQSALQLARSAQSTGVRCVVTTSFESSIGVAAALHLAAALPNAAGAHGLATVEHLAADLATEPLLPAGGVLELGREPGLGVRLDEARLEAVATGPWREATA